MIIQLSGKKNIIFQKDLQLLVPPSLAKSNALEVGNSGEIIPLKMVESQAIENALNMTHGNVQESAKKLKMARVTLYRKIKEYGLSHLTRGR